MGRKRGKLNGLLHRGLCTAFSHRKPPISSPIRTATGSSPRLLNKPNDEQKSPGIYLKFILDHDQLQETIYMNMINVKCVQAERAAYAEGARRIRGEAERVRHRYDSTALHGVIILCNQGAGEEMIKKMKGGFFLSLVQY